MSFINQAEKDRLNALDQYQILDTPPEESFDRITRIVQSILHVPISLISLIDENRQWFKSRQGMAVHETPRDVSFCNHAIQTNEAMIVQDALLDPRFAENPLVTGDPYIRFYMGAPIRTPSGYNLGTVCAIDTVPRTPTAEQVSSLTDLSRLVVDQLELRRIATIDSLTGALTRHAFLPALEAEAAMAKRFMRPLSVIILDADFFKKINDTYGHAGGDIVLQNIAAICKSALRVNDSFGRLGGEEFAIVLPETSLPQAIGIAERLRLAMRVSLIPWEGEQINFTCSFGVAEFSGADPDAAAFIGRADRALYQAKQQGRDMVVPVPAKPQD
jgi:diguanylate cyclase (GGDEF)-like protein